MHCIVVAVEIIAPFDGITVSSSEVFGVHMAGTLTVLAVLTTVLTLPALICAASSG